MADLGGVFGAFQILISPLWSHTSLDSIFYLMLSLKKHHTIFIYCKCKPSETKVEPAVEPLPSTFVHTKRL